MADLSGLHILIVPAWWPSPEEPISGIFHTDYARAFASAGARVGVVFPDMVRVRHFGRGTQIPLWPKLIREQMDGIGVIRIRGLHTALRMPWMQMTQFRRWLRRGFATYVERYGRPDLLHAMCSIPAGWACTHLDDPLSTRVVITDGTGPFSLAMTPPSAAAYVRKAMDGAAAVVAVSELCRRQMQAEGIVRDIAVCGNCVADSFVSANVQPARPDRKRRALFVGRLTAAKGIGELIDAAVALASEFDVRWHFLGDGPMAATLRRRFDDAGLADRLTLHGTCSRPAVIEQMSHSDLLVLPSHGESFGLAAAEALCMGLPIVTTRGTACAEFVDEDNGILVTMRDAESLTCGLRRMIERLETYDRLAIAERARLRFSPEVLARWYGGLFRRILGR